MGMVFRRNSIIVVYLDPLGIVKPESLSGLGVRYVDGVCLCGFYELLRASPTLSQARAPDPNAKLSSPSQVSRIEALIVISLSGVYSLGFHGGIPCFLFDRFLQPR